MTLISTPRLHLRELTADDAGFIHELLNDPDWLRFIGDRGVRTLEDARDYITGVYMQAYARHGYGLWAVVAKDEGQPIGICGLVTRDWLDAPDLGFAFLPEARGKGLAREAAAATLEYAASLGLPRLFAVTTPDNAASQRLLQEIGFESLGLREREGEAPLSLFARELA